MTTVIAASVAQAQDAPFRNGEEAELLTNFVREKQISAADLEQLSRLLPDPNDQINWMTRTGEQRRTAGEDTVARDIAERADARKQKWQTRGVPVDDAVELALSRLIAAIKPIFDIIDPAKLVDRLRRMSPAELQALDSNAKFILFSRGIADTVLPDAEQTLYKTARSVLDVLASNAQLELPTITRLLDVANAVTAAPSPAGGPDDAATAALTVSRALLNRSLGMDSVDSRQEDWGKAEYWADRADALEKNNLWRWAALARLLEAANATGTDSRRLAANRAKESWDKLRFVTNALNNVRSTWPLVDAWLERLDRDSPDQLERPAAVPLSPDFRSRDRAARRSFETQFLSSLDAGRDEDAFRFMLLAKASDLSLIGPAPLSSPTIDDLKRMFGQEVDGKVAPRDVHLFLEILESTAAGAPRYDALAIHVITGGMDSADGYVVEWIKNQSSPAALVQQALAWMPQGFGGARMIVALDGAWRGPAWLDAEKLLTARINVNETRSWLYYVPSASALRSGSPWQLEPTLRAWYLSLAHASDTYLMCAVAEQAGGPPLSIQDSPILGTQTLMSAIQLGTTVSRRVRTAPRGGWSKYSQTLVSLKSGDARETFPILVSRP